MRKIITAALIAATSSFAHASFTKLETNFGMMTEFDEPQYMQEGPYPTGINTDGAYRASCESPYASCSGNYNFFGFKFALTDTFIWNDGGYIDKYNNALPGSFYINAFAGGEKYSYHVVDTGDRWLFGNFYNEAPTPESIKQIYFTLTSDDGQFGAFVFDNNRTDFYIGDRPLALVPEPKTFALLLLGAVGLCVRRQSKATTAI